MTAEEEIVNQLKNRFPGTEDIRIHRPRRIWARVNPEDLMDVCTHLKDEMNFDSVSSISGVDRRTNFEVSYMLWSTTRKIVLILTVPVSKEPQSIPSVTNIWRGANWHEREIYDMLGIKFENHPDLRRILLPEDTDYYPLRKNFKYSTKRGE